MGKFEDLKIIFKKIVALTEYNISKSSNFQTFKSFS
jgi:hypothetical protein